MPAGIPTKITPRLARPPWSRPSACLPFGCRKSPRRAERDQSAGNDLEAGSMKRQRLVAWGYWGLALGVLASLVAIGLIPPRRVLNVEAFPLVQVGMTQDEVEALLGGPPGNYGRHSD